VNVEEIRARLIHVFPPQPFHGLVSAQDECDEGIAPRQEQGWDEVFCEALEHLIVNPLAIFSRLRRIAGAIESSQRW
jgi:hypothetical protein